MNFHTDSASLTNEAVDVLDNVAAKLVDCPVDSITITAHTDSVGSEEYNQALSERRAHYVVEYLSTRGVERQTLRATAFGETQPIDSNDTAEGRSRNRRVEIFTD